jgi:amidase
MTRKSQNQSRHRPKPLAYALLALGFTALIACSDSPEPAPEPAPIAQTPSTQPAALQDSGAPTADLAQAIAQGARSSVDAVNDTLQRIETLDRSGPTLRSVIAINPQALEQARALDAQSGPRGPLHGVPILLKDNIESLDPMPTTAGSLALAKSVTARDAPLVARLRAAGAVIVGKANLSEWANIRSRQSTSGWSAVGGLTRNPHVLDRNTCGSSSGSAAAVAAGIVSAAIGTETDGSITCPASINGIVGFKPTVGLVSRRYIVPISSSQDTAGPMTRSVRDAALLLSVMAGSDPQDPATAEADQRKRDFVTGLNKDALQGKRVGLVDMPGVDPQLIAAAAKRLQSAGAIVVPIAINPADYQALGQAEFKVLLVELKHELTRYLQSLPEGASQVRSLADVVQFNKENSETELQYFRQETLEAALKEVSMSDASYLHALADARRMARTEGLDALFQKHDIQLLVGQTNSPAWLSTLGKGDAFALPSLSRLPAVAGYPHLTVPMGAIAHLPVGLSFIGLQWQDAEVLAAGFAFEQAGPPLRLEPKFLASQKAAEASSTP